ncbi:NAD(P)/FAD-dependent oxidoreductase [Mesorhizobium intechi]|uniref:NAD(P)/FAD-dependent oxidoreductase n=1 Tax=Mesorhizobium intechi TaxID=537601 RepID=A0A8T9AJF8_9HYPH|nr:NAD(P)/FAD-dependent oxidoreductase [Mesorhizobium intechi]TSE03100.1 NAD(P)/FAD-dependent oxidoreductase [Mesorhizobium intechi]
MSGGSHFEAEKPLDIAVVGSGIAGLSAAWLLSTRHRVSLFEADRRLGGHSNTVDAGGTPVDTGFIVYNEVTYPNLTALFAHLGVRTKSSDMSFAVSLDGGRLEYSGTGLRGLLAQPTNVGRLRFWSMLKELLRFYREAPYDIARIGEISLAEYLDAKGYGAAFREDHLYPMAAAIWSTPALDVSSYPAAAFIRFCENHGLLKLAARPIWRTVDGGSRKYVELLAKGVAGRAFTGRCVRSIARRGGAVWLTDCEGSEQRFDHVVVATHADQALRILADPSSEETRQLGSFGYSRNEAVLHSDPRLMPRRKRAWSSWNYLTEGPGETRRLSVTYWMNRLQSLPDDQQLFVTLNPVVEPEGNTVRHSETYEHPVFDAVAMRAQRQLWSLQGGRNTWFCGAYFGAGFHEDGLQAGLAVAEALGGVRRPWNVPHESGRIHIVDAAARRNLAAA